ncbi:hypothetical protein SAMD00019534_126580 [Acytostelium subglobosum LB1]|uniref:hypothetical protein n=1 Tax=Acytostelium subglobosum LB1 TaxID=1410327 RepID=UPI000644B313|nr:hypothetical protein SAMD00019534_126580 [Acytostelium subglobosum LB1]GAM29482.1 hypothetical protein SAMD00019534_126580 [Acytostelium subglobosum LB1]|eukprot:XP_012747568.1 hypothetical protein SAMD00019534_126580 [Acytostelium subglobosum LB1]
MFLGSIPALRSLLMPPSVRFRVCNASRWRNDPTEASKLSVEVLGVRRNAPDPFVSDDRGAVAENTQQQ